MRPIFPCSSQGLGAVWAAASSLGAQTLGWARDVALPVPASPPFPSLASFFLPPCHKQRVPRGLLTHLCLQTRPADSARVSKPAFAQVTSANLLASQAHHSRTYAFRSPRALFRFPMVFFPEPTGKSSMNFRPEDRRSGGIWVQVSFCSCQPRGLLSFLESGTTRLEHCN